MPGLLFYNIIPLEADLKKNNLELYIEKLLTAPFWIKQAVYFKLSEDLKDDNCDVANKFALLVPTLTFQGQTELSEKKCFFDNNIYNFLDMCSKGFSILEISMSAYFSIEEVAKFLEFCIEQGFIKEPDKNILTFGEFISGKLRLGEYLKEIGILNNEQLENTVKNQNGKKFGEALIALGYLKKDDIRQLLILKDEAQKRFVSDYNDIPKISCEFCNDEKRYENEILNLKEENKILKRKMGQLLQLVRNND